MVRLNKRGVSPLIATVLLIAFAVSLGAVIMNLGANLSSKCSAVDLDFHKVGETSRLCYDKDSSTLRFTISNRGVKVDGYKVIAVGDQSDVEEFFVTLGEFEKEPGQLPITGTSVQDVSLVPYLSESGSIRVCSQKVVEYTNVVPC